MAKKKSRSVNVARKREKRNRARKSKSKQIAVEKHHKLPLDRMDEERLHSYLLKSYDLLDEPEIQKVYFDLDLLETELLDYINRLAETDSNLEEDTQLVLPDSYQDTNHQNAEQEDTQLLLEESFLLNETDVLSRLITTPFKKHLLSSLSTCENRLKKNGEHQRAEVVSVTRSLFEIVPTDVMAGHPIIQRIGQQSIQQLIEERINSEELSAVSEYLPKVHKIEYNEFQQNESFPSLFSDAISKKLNDIHENQQESITKIPSLAQEQESELYPEILPAKALYKNFDGLEIRDSLINWKGQSLKKETDTQLDFINKDNEFYITVTENRLQLHAESEEKLTTAMANLETHCKSAVMYLAKTFDEGGETDAT